MCNCYSAKCEYCDIEIPMHLGDFNTDPSEIKVFCHTHIPADNKEVVVHDIKGKYGREICGTTKVGILPLTDNAKKNMHHNYPNI